MLGTLGWAISGRMITVLCSMFAVFPERTYSKSKCLTDLECYIPATPICRVPWWVHAHSDVMTTDESSAVQSDRRRWSHLTARMAGRMGWGMQSVRGAETHFIKEESTEYFADHDGQNTNEIRSHKRKPRDHPRAPWLLGRPLRRCCPFPPESSVIHAPDNS